jgi:hypothetical protein
MAEQFNSPLPQSHASTLREHAIRRLSRSPHPYHKQNSELPYASERVKSASPSNKSFSSAGSSADEERDSHAPVSEQHRESTTSDSGTEADDEHFLKGLPAPRLRPPKGLRGADGSLSGTSTPLLSPAIRDEVVYGRLGNSINKSLLPEDQKEKEVLKAVETFRHNRRIEIVRRVTEGVILGFVGVILSRNSEVRELVSLFKKGKAPDIYVTCRANCSRTILRNPHRSIPYSCISLSIITAHKPPPALESTTPLGIPGILRSCSHILPTNDYHLCLYSTLHPQPRWASARHNTINILPSEEPYTVNWRARRFQYTALGTLFHPPSLGWFYQKFICRSGTYPAIWLGS